MFPTTIFEVVRFLWNATRGQRLTPWRSPFLKWRIETFSGMHADSMTGRDVFRFLWESRRDLMDFLLWSGRLKHQSQRRSAPDADRPGNQGSF